MKRQYYFMVAVAVLMIGLLTGCEHDNGKLEKTEKAQLGVPLPDDFEAEEIMNRKKESEEVAAVEKTREDNNIIEENFDTKETKGRTPGQMQYDPKIMDYDPEDTIYYKTYYDDFVQGKIMNIDYYPHIEILDEMEDYFADDSEVFYLDNLISMFYDDRTIETDEKELEQLFWEHGYILYLHSVEFLDFHLRFIEIAEKEGLSLYPIRILMQTWDEDYIYLSSGYYWTDSQKDKRYDGGSQGRSMEVDRAFLRVFKRVYFGGGAQLLGIYWFLLDFGANGAGDRYKSCVFSGKSVS